jgi:hypothetical protein
MAALSDGEYSVATNMLPIFPDGCEIQGHEIDDDIDSSEEAS